MLPCGERTVTTERVQWRGESHMPIRQPPRDARQHAHERSSRAFLEPAPDVRCLVHLLELNLEIRPWRIKYAPCSVSVVASFVATSAVSASTCSRTAGTPPEKFAPPHRTTPRSGVVCGRGAPPPEPWDQRMEMKSAAPPPHSRWHTRSAERNGRLTVCVDCSTRCDRLWLASPSAADSGNALRMLASCSRRRRARTTAPPGVRLEHAVPDSRVKVRPRRARTPTPSKVATRAVVWREYCRQSLRRRPPPLKNPTVSTADVQRGIAVVAWVMVHVRCSRHGNASGRPRRHGSRVVDGRRTCGPARPARSRAVESRQGHLVLCDSGGPIQSGDELLCTTVCGRQASGRSSPQTRGCACAARDRHVSAPLDAARTDSARCDLGRERDANATVHSFSRENLASEMCNGESALGDNIRHTRTRLHRTCCMTSPAPRYRGVEALVSLSTLQVLGGAGRTGAPAECSRLQKMLRRWRAAAGPVSSPECAQHGVQRAAQSTMIFLCSVASCVQQRRACRAHSRRCQDFIGIGFSGHPHHAERFHRINDRSQDAHIRHARNVSTAASHTAPLAQGRWVFSSPRSPLPFSSRILTDVALPSAFLL
eukprot:ctg_941.g370